MKTLFYFAYFGLLLPLLLACQKNTIEPTGQITDTFSDTSASRSASCDNYTYLYKYWEGELEKRQLGKAQAEKIIVGFADNFSAADRQILLSLFPQFASIDSEGNGEFTSYTVVRLKPGGTCFEAEKMIKGLQKHKSVLFAYPTFGDSQSWTGLTNELLVAMEGTMDGPDAEAYSKLSKLANKENVTILDLYLSFPLDETNWLYMYILSVDKEAKRNTLDFSSLLNKQPYIKEAVPNFIFGFDFGGPIIVSDQATTTTARQIKEKGSTAFKKPKNN